MSPGRLHVDGVEVPARAHLLSKGREPLRNTHVVRHSIHRKLAFLIGPEGRNTACLTKLSKPLGDRLERAFVRSATESAEEHDKAAQGQTDDTSSVHANDPVWHAGQMVFDCQPGRDSGVASSRMVGLAEPT